MKYYWLSDNLVEFDGPFKSKKAAIKDCCETMKSIGDTASISIVKVVKTGEITVKHKWKS